MGGYKPIHITGNKEGLIQSREEFILPHDAYPVLQNAFVWRERIKKKQGGKLLGRLKRTFQAVSIGDSSLSPWSFNLLAVSGYVFTTDTANPGQVTTKYPHRLSNGDIVNISGVVGATGYNSTFTITVVDPKNFTVGVDASGFGAYVSGGYWISNRSLSATEPNAELIPRSVSITIGSGGGAITFTDTGNGTLTSTTPGNSGTINYLTGDVVLTHTAGAGVATAATFSYAPGFPVMGIRSQVTSSLNVQNALIFDTKYCYRYTGTFSEYLPGTIWTGTDYNFFWSANYWQTGSARLFWATNFSGPSGDPIRYTDGTTWTDFAPQINATPHYLQQCLCILPFRSRLVVFNTYEGSTLAAATNYPQRIRWAAIGTPLTTGTGSNANAWRDDIPGQGGYIDVPTSESIVSVGFVRDNLVIYCERSTWQLRYTGRSIQPFVVEKVNSELGSASTFSAVQFDTSLVGVGDKGIVSCDSYKSERIDIKIPDLVFTFNNTNQGPQRVCGFRDFYQRIAYWMYPYVLGSTSSVTYPNRRLIYNYDNDSWAIYNDSYTSLGNLQPLSGKTWLNSGTWQSANFPWVGKKQTILPVAGGNQQGFVLLLDQKATNDPSLSITDIATDNITITNHNLDEDQVIVISSMPSGTYSYLNGKVFSISIVDKDTIELYAYSEDTKEFSDKQGFPAGTYVGGGQAAIRDNFYIQSKKFSYIDEGQSIQLGFIDILMPQTNSGEITLNVLLNYNESNPINTSPENNDSFFNQTVPTYNPQNNIEGSKYWQRVYCPIRGNFITIVWTFSEAQMASDASVKNVEIDAQVVWMRQSGRMTNL